mmetsp:Transcript_21875/g.57057  ORF Transcript_21875/g.57057 Transcript_21875/m.57057 type:complete len:654 (-) Transcript_21875:119-2080(-)
MDRDLTPRDAPPPPPGLDNVIIVDNVPVIPKSKVDKLTKALRTKFSPYTAPGETLRIDLPMANEEKSAGYAFIEFRTSQQAGDAKAKMDGHKFDKKHSFTINLMSEFDDVMKTTEEWEKPSEKNFDDREVLNYWLTDKACRDQFATRVDNMTSVYWCRRNDKALVVERENWSERGVQWSPKGNYLATFHPMGIKLHGGKRWSLLQKFKHPGVEEISFSPGEKYLVTFSSRGDGVGIALFWDIAQERMVSEMQVRERSGGPVIKWSHDDKYFAKLKDKKPDEEHHQGITVFSTPAFEILDKKSIKIENVQGFEWSPTDNIISYWVPEAEQGNMPAKVVLMDIPSRKELTANNMVLLKSCRMVWQKSGDYMAVSAERYVNKNKKNVYTQFLVFSMREKLIPCERMKVEDKIQNMAFEPVGSKLAVLVGETPRISLKILGHVDHKLTELHTYEKVTANSLHWSPRGQFLVAAGLGSMQGVLEFFDTNAKSSYSTGEHFMASTVEWDPTGRFVSSVVSCLNYGTDTGYYLWTFQGKLVQRELAKNFYQLAWRPRPLSLLTKKDISGIKKNLKKYHTQFESEDKMAATAASEEVMKKRRDLLEAWEDFNDNVIYRQSKNRELMESLRPPEDDSEMNEIIETVEVFQKEEVEQFEAKIT